MSMISIKPLSLFQPHGEAAEDALNALGLPGKLTADTAGALPPLPVKCLDGNDTAAQLPAYDDYIRVRPAKLLHQRLRLNALPQAARHLFLETIKRPGGFCRLKPFGYLAWGEPIGRGRVLTLALPLSSYNKTHTLTSF